MTFVVTFKVDGTPVPKGRPRFARMGKFVRTYTDSKTKNNEDTIKQVALIAMGASKPLETPLEAFIYISLAIPVSYSKKRKEACLNGSEKPITRGDIDNFCKQVMDACNGIIYVDDRQIISLHSTKVYGEPFIEVMFREAE
jgi:Holliday junction resolvase RusA-like endonuclease